MSGTKVITNISNNKQTHLKNPSKSSQISHFTLNFCSLRSQMWFVLTCIYVLLWTRSGWKALIHFHQNLWQMTWNRFKQDFEHKWVNKNLIAGFVVHLSLICDTVLTSDVDWQEFQNHNKFDFISFNLSYSHHLFYFLYRSNKNKTNRPTWTMCLPLAIKCRLAQLVQLLFCECYGYETVLNLFILTRGPCFENLLALTFCY